MGSLRPKTAKGEGSTGWIFTWNVAANFDKNDPKELKMNISRNIIPKEWLDIKFLANITQTKWVNMKNSTQQEYVWHSSTQSEGRIEEWGEKKGSRARGGIFLPTMTWEVHPTTMALLFPLTSYTPQSIGHPHPKPIKLRQAGWPLLSMCICCSGVMTTPVVSGCHWGSQWVPYATEEHTAIWHFL